MIEQIYKFKKKDFNQNGINIHNGPHYRTIVSCGLYFLFHILFGSPSLRAEGEAICCKLGEIASSLRSLQ